MRIAAVILAAGESRRMGRPKAMLPFRGGTFLSELASTMAQKCSPVIAVLGHQADSLKEMMPSGLIAVENREYQKGMLTSLQAGLRALPQESDAALFTLVDHPAVRPATLEAITASAAKIAIPRFAGRRGHPVLIRRDVIAEFLAEPLASQVRDVINRHEGEIEYIEVDDPGINDDIDDPALYQQLLAREVAQ